MDLNNPQVVELDDDRCQKSVTLEENSCEDNCCKEEEIDSLRDDLNLSTMNLSRCEDKCCKESKTSNKKETSCKSQNLNEDCEDDCCREEVPNCCGEGSCSETINQLRRQSDCEHDCDDCKQEIIIDAYIKRNSNVRSKQINNLDDCEHDCQDCKQAVTDNCCSKGNCNNESTKVSNCSKDEEIIDDCCSKGNRAGITNNSSDCEDECCKEEEIIDDCCNKGYCTETKNIQDERDECKEDCCKKLVELDDCEDDCCKEEEVIDNCCSKGSCASELSKSPVVTEECEDDCCSKLVELEDDCEDECCKEVIIDDCCNKGICSSDSKKSQPSSNCKDDCCKKTIQKSSCKDDCCSKSNEFQMVQLDDDDDCSKPKIKDDCCSKPTSSCKSNDNTSKNILYCCSLCTLNSCCKSDCCIVVCCIVAADKNAKIKSIDSSILSLNVSGMTCADCATSVEKHLMKFSAVSAVRVSAMTHKAEVFYNRNLLTSANIIQEVIKLGFGAEITSSPDLCNLSVNLTGNWDFEVVKSKLEKKTGVVGVNCSGNTILIDYNPEIVGPRTIFNMFNELGYSATLTASHIDSSLLESNKWQNSLIISIILSIPVVLLAFVFPMSSKLNSAFETEVTSGLSVKVLLMWLFATPIQLWIGGPLYVSAYKALRYAHSANVDTLVMLSTSTAYFYSVISTILAMSGSSYNGESFFETSAILLTLIILGRYLEFIAKGKTSNTIKKLLQLQVTTATVLNMETEQVVDAQLIERGDVLKVTPGLKIPTDGIIVYGHSSIDESMITGEPLPVYKTVNNIVYGGTINQLGVIHIRVTKCVGESTVSNIVKLVQEAQSVKAPIQRIGDTVSSYFVPVIICLSVIVFIIWVSLASSGKVVTDQQSAFTFALQFFIAVLVISCPCAIALAVPTAIMVGTGVGAKYGILFKGGSVIETCHKINTIVFDKTGTLTYGKPTIIDFKVFTNQFQETFLSIVGSAELGSQHPIAKAIVKYAQDKNALVEPSNFQEIPGRGLSCRVQKNKVFVGNKEWIKDKKVEMSKHVIETIQGMERQGQTVVCVAIDGLFVGVLGLSDTPREEVKMVVEMLQQSGIEVWMLSGDNQKTADAVASQLGIRHVLGNALPSDKTKKIQQLQKEGRIVAMIGDGINDSPALTQADVGIAVASGTDIAIDAADVVLMKENLEDLLVVMNLSRTIFKCIKFNFAWAFFYNILGIPLAAGAFYSLGRLYVPPPFAGLSEILSSLPVVLFSLLLYTYKPKY